MAQAATVMHDVHEAYSESRFFELWAEHPHLATEMMKNAVKLGSVNAYQAIEVISRTELGQPNWQLADIQWADYYRLSLLTFSFLYGEENRSTGKYVFPYDLDVQRAALKTMLNIASANEIRAVFDAMNRLNDSLARNGTIDRPWDSEFVLSAIDKIIQNAAEGKSPKLDNSIDLIAQFSQFISQDDLNAWDCYFHQITNNEEVIFSAPRKEPYRTKLNSSFNNSVQHLQNYVAVLLSGDISNIGQNKTLAGVIEAAPENMAVALVGSAPKYETNSDAFEVMKRIFIKCSERIVSKYGLAGNKYGYWSSESGGGETLPSIFDSVRGAEPLANIFSRAVTCGLLPEDVSVSLDIMKRTRAHLKALEELLRDSRQVAFGMDTRFTSFFKNSGAEGPA
jgi:hypothetical protein